ncbi:BaiN/RdsA family NAD(P)/FAD-dependent oxidoreductase [Hirschia baltica]|uniref:HI0933 family protein n=1 Tax=Hirschia baltica (strain ATCC 49814 / DSM 5838 / IFAM 1418) TaxID=582402 RepID=C6XRP3_HIRBI|nr:NAD(P)/FAD-dependent oxidoreductase [Hirschia baltica]ACT60653.1 HI0933 family protein [Hirschia baltica ATCC 49814]
MSSENYDIIVLGAGAAGLFSAIEAGKRGRSVCVIDHAKKPAEKVRISGGGRCNFTNVNTHPSRFISQNPHFCKSALKQYTQHDFIARVDQQGIKYHEKTLGQLFCDDSATEIIQMLLDDCAANNVEIRLSTEIIGVSKRDTEFLVQTSIGNMHCESLIVATGGLSIPKMGATPFAYELAKQFGLNIIDPRPGLVPFMFGGELLAEMSELSGVSVRARIDTGEIAFDEAMLFTHRGLSGPAALQASSYWLPGNEIEVNLAQRVDALAALKKGREEAPKKKLASVLETFLPSRLAQSIAEQTYASFRMADLSNAKLEEIAKRISAWRLKPVGTEGYRTAEVTIGGIDTNDLSSKTMEAKNVAGLFFIGEAVDVTGWLGGYNFQWAWSSGYVAGQNA